jgi:hypothetical protein
MARGRLLLVFLLLGWGLHGAALAQVNVAVRGKVLKITPQGILVQPANLPEGEPLAISASARTPVRMNFRGSIDKIIPGTYVEMQVLWDGAERLRATAIKLPNGRPTKFGLFEG